MKPVKMWALYWASRSGKPSEAFICRTEARRCAQGFYGVRLVRVLVTPLVPKKKRKVKK